MSDLILNVVASLAFSGLLTAALVFLARSWISQRLKSAIEHEYAEKLATYETRLKAEHDVALEKLKASNAQSQSVLAAATASLAKTHEAAQEKRLHALETFWKAMVQVRTKCPGVVSFLDVLLPEEYDTLLTNPVLASSMGQFKMDIVTNDLITISAGIDDARLYAGEYPFALFWAYRAIVGRIAFKVADGKVKGKIEDWAADSGIRQLMGTVLSSKEIEEFNRMKISRITWLSNQIEQKMLTYSGKIISGEASGEFGLEQARKIAAAASELESKQKAKH